MKRIPSRPAVLLLGCSLAARAQNYSLDWFKIAAGGGNSTNGQYCLLFRSILLIAREGKRTALDGTVPTLRS